MSFDPTKPAENTPLDAAEMRSQLTSLKALIDAILSVTTAQVDGVSTLNPGDPASASASITGNTLHVSFGLPRGNDGAQGPPFADAVVDGVTTLDPGSPADVSVTFDGTNVRFSFSIPRGQDGSPGPSGSDGAPGQNGADGAQGPPGEVSNADLANAINGTSNNTNAVGILGLSISDPPQQWEVQQIANKLDELIDALRR